MKNDSELIFDLLIMQYWYDFYYTDNPVTTEFFYKFHIQQTAFLALKSCFAENEVQANGIKVDCCHCNRESIIDLDFNFIKEV